MLGWSGTGQDLHGDKVARLSLPFARDAEAFDTVDDDSASFATDPAYSAGRMRGFQRQDDALDRHDELCVGRSRAARAKAVPQSVTRSSAPNLTSLTNCRLGMLAIQFLGQGLVSVPTKPTIPRTPLTSRAAAVLTHEGIDKHALETGRDAKAGSRRRIAFCDHDGPRTA